jgi:serine/threonine protein kinase
MEQERNIRIAELFNEALTLEPTRRSSFLRHQCTSDEELYRRVNDLLSAYAEVKTLGPISQMSGSLELLDSTTLLALGERYEGIRLIGHGGMGIVFRAHDREIGKVVALKILHPWLANDQRAIDRFRNEIRLALEITHENVCRTYGLERFEQTILISMEYIEGENLRSILKRTKEIPVAEASAWAKQICGALAAAHDKRVVHRDLKPENIMIDHEGHVKVMDFGIARLIGAAEVTSGAVIGTPRYMSPEQALGKAAGPASDIYSLGLVLYEMFN